MTPSTSKGDVFIGHLLTLQARSDRGALADLRADLRDHPSDRYRAGKHVVPFLGDEENPNDKWYYLVGALFALHPSHSDSAGNFGASLKKLRAESSDSLDARVLALLDADRTDVARHLRGLVGQLASKGIPVNYRVLLRNLCFWDRPDRSVQRDWARDYYRASQTAVAKATQEGEQT